MLLLTTKSRDNGVSNNFSNNPKNWRENSGLRITSWACVTTKLKRKHIFGGIKSFSSFIVIFSEFVKKKLERKMFSYIIGKKLEGKKNYTEFVKKKFEL